MKRTRLFVVALAALTLGVGASALADGKQTVVKIAPGTTTVAAPKVRTIKSIPPLNDTAITDAKAQAAKLHSVKVNSAPKGLTGPLNLGALRLENKVGSVSGNMSVINVALVDPGVESYEMKQAEGVLILEYKGLTKGTIYLLDCTVYNLPAIDVTVGAFDHLELKGTTTSVPVNQSHVLVGFAAPGPNTTIVLHDAHSPQADWDIAPCTLHPVD